LIYPGLWYNSPNNCPASKAIYYGTLAERSTIMVQAVVSLAKLIFKSLTWDPKFLLSAINPRDLDDLEPEDLMPDIVRTDGQITNPIMVWKVESEHPIWDKVRNTLTNEPVEIPVKEREKYRILIRGHRRCYCVQDILRPENENMSELLRKNAAKVPIREVACSEEQARELAMDFEESRGLHPWNVLKLVFEH
jgi:hypothetical protein